MEATHRALVDLKKQIVVVDHDNDNHNDDEEKEMERKAAMKKGMGDCWAVKLNSGKFGVPWAVTRQVLERAGLEITVVSMGDSAAAVASTENIDTKKEETNPDTKKRREGATGQRRKRVRTDQALKDEDDDEVEGKVRIGVVKRERIKKGVDRGREGGRIDQWLRQR